MFPRSAVPAHPQPSTKRIVVCSGCVSIAFFAAVLFSFHGGLQAPKGIPADRRISGVPMQNQPRLIASYGKLPLSFEVNQGQADPQVKFLSRGRGHTLFLTGDEAVLALAKPSAFSSQLSAKRIPGSQSWNPMEGRGRLLALPGRLQRTTDHRPRITPSTQNPKSKNENEFVRLRLAGANPNAAVTGYDELPGKANYFIGNDPRKWRTNVPTYAKVRYHDVYPGVELEYYGNQNGQLEYDFVVAPGADPSAIALDVGAGLVPAGGRPQGAPLQVDRAGDLVFAAQGSEIRFHKPLIYQPGVRPSLIAGHSSMVQGRFVVDARNRIHFALGPYDRTKALVIDPVLTYSTYLGGSGNDYANAIAVDSSGNAYVTGAASSTDFPTVNPFQATNASYGNSYSNAFVSKINPSGSALVYSTYLGGSGGAIGYGIAVDPSGNAYLTGTAGVDFPTVNSFQPTPKGSAFVIKLNAAGSALVYSTYLGGSYADVGYGIAVDPPGNAYVAGWTGSVDFPTVNPLQATLKGETNAFVSKLNAGDSALVYSTYLGGSVSDYATGIAVDPSGNACVTGYAESRDFPTVNPLQATNNNQWGQSNGFVAELAASGSALVYSTYLGGSGQYKAGDQGNAIAVDSSGNAYVTGYTMSTDFPTVNPLQATLDGQRNVFVSKLNANGSALVYSTYLGGSAYDQGNGIAVDSSGNAYVTGWTQSGDFPTVNPIQTSYSGPPFGNAFVAELAASGSALVYSTYLGGSYNEPNVNTCNASGNGIAVDSSGNAHVAGYTYSSDFPTVNPLQATKRSTIGGTTSGFVAELSPGPAAAASFSTPILNFGTVLEDTTSPQRSVTLSNLGNASLTLTSITTSGDFALVTTATSCPYGGGAVAPEANCTIDVTFTPTATGVRTGTLTVADNASGSPQTVQLSGTGFFPPPNVSPTSLSFNSQLAGTTSAAQSVTVTNTSKLALNIVSLGISGDFAQTNNCLPSLAPSTSCTIKVTFSPTAAGTQTGTMTLTDNASNSPQIVQLSGTGMDFTMSSSATSQTVSPGQVANYSLMLNPESGYDDTVNLTCTGAPSLSTCTLTPNHAMLNGTASATVAVAVSTTAPSFAPPRQWLLPPSLRGLGKMFWLYALLGLASAAALASARTWRAACLLGGCVLLVVLWAACGGGGGQVIHTLGTPPGTYTVDVTATDATTPALSHTLQLTLTVD